jgi:predicted phosphoribosyltransferase
VGLFVDRADAGRRLAPEIARALVAAPATALPLVLALPRGGVPVAVEIAAALAAPLDVLVVRKLGVPGHAELAFGAIATGGARVLNEDIVAAAHVDAHAIDAVVATETEELERRERRYRGDRPVRPVVDRTVVVVDDGLATGATMRAAVLALRARGAAHVIAAAPVGPHEACALLDLDADAVICLVVPRHFRAVGAWYEDFSAVQDATVAALLDRAAADESAMRRG